MNVIWKNDLYAFVIVTLLSETITPTGKNILLKAEGGHSCYCLCFTAHFILKCVLTNLDFFFIVSQKGQNTMCPKKCFS